MPFDLLQSKAPVSRPAAEEARWRSDRLLMAAHYHRQPQLFEGWRRRSGVLLRLKAPSLTHLQILSLNVGVIVQKNTQTRLTSSLFSATWITKTTLGGCSHCAPADKMRLFITLPTPPPTPLCGLFTCEWCVYPRGALCLCVFAQADLERAAAWGRNVSSSGKPFD